MKRTFFVDVDGTLVNTMPAIYKALCSVFSYFGVEPPKFSEYVLGIWDSYYTFYSERIPHLRSEEELFHLWRMYLEEHDSGTPETFEGADEFISRASDNGVELVLLSANAGPTVDRWLDQNNRRNKFSAIYTGAVEKAKVIESHLNRTGKEKVWAYMIGDSLLDCHAAKTAGIEFSCVLHDFSQCTLEHSVPTDCLVAIRHYFEERGHFVSESFFELSSVLLPE